MSKTTPAENLVDKILTFEGITGLLCKYCGSPVCPGARGGRCPVEERDYKKAKNKKYERKENV